MFVIDFLTAFILTVALTLLVAGIFNQNRNSGVRDLSGTVLLVLIASWIGGIWLTAFGPLVTATHWIPFALATLTFVSIAAVFACRPSFRREINRPSGSRGYALRFATTAYFIVTLLLFFSAVSLRFYLGHT